MNLKKNFDHLSTKKKAFYIRNYYDQKKGDDLYATSPDFNLRELEIDFIIKNVSGKKILDLGCGNGYTTLRIAEKLKAKIWGVDFSAEMIRGAERIQKRWKKKLKSRVEFIVADATTFKPPVTPLDAVISERFLLNLPSKKSQYQTIVNIYKLLKNKGLYLMIEGSQNGLKKINALRKSFGLEPILDRAQYNLSSRKFKDQELLKFLKDYFRVVEIKSFDLYYIISRLVYPKMIFPAKPDYKNPINALAKDLALKTDFTSQGIGHVKGYVLEKKS